MIDPDQNRILTTITQSKRAWVDRSKLEPAQLVDQMVLSGILDPWPEEQAVTLSARTAAVLRVRLEEFGLAEIPRWVPESDPIRPVRLFTRLGSAFVLPLAHPESIQDQTPGPADILIDQVSEKPIILFGRTVRIDSRIK